MNVELGKEITVGSSHVEIGEALATRARTELIELASKYFGKLTNAAVHFSRDGYLYRCSINLQPGGVARINAEGEFKDAHGALDAAIERVRVQLLKIKSERRDDKHHRQPMA